MSHRVGKGGLFPPEDLPGQIPQPLKGVAQQVLALAVAVDLHRRVQAHHIPHEVQIPEGNSRLQRVDGDAPVCPQHVVHVQLPDALFRLLLERLRRRGKVGVLIPEQLVGDLPGEEHPDIRLPVDRFAHKIHPHARPDGGYIEGAQQVDHLFQCLEHLPAGHIHLRVIRADIVRCLPGVFQVDGVTLHADGKGADGPVALPGGDGAHQRGIQPAGEQKAHLRVGVETLSDPGDQLVPDGAAGGLQIVVTDLRHGGDIAVGDEGAVLVIVSRGKRADLVHKFHEVFGLAGKDDGPGRVVAVIQGPDADGIPGGDECLSLCIVEDAGKLRIEHGEHIRPVLPVQGQQDLTVAVGGEGVAFLPQLLPQGPEAVEFPVADGQTAFKRKGLHTGGRQSHDGQPVKAQKTRPGGGQAGVVGAPGLCLGKAPGESFHIGHRPAITDDRTHDAYSTSCRASKPSSPVRTLTTFSTS